MLIDINLLPKKEKKRSFIWVPILVVLCLIGISVFLYYLYNEQVENKRKLQAVVMNLEVEKVSLETEAKKSEEVIAQEKLLGAIEWVQANQYFTYVLLGELTAILPEEAYVLNFAFQEAGSVSVNIQFDSSREAAFYLKRLMNHDVILEAKLLSVQTSNVSDSEVGSDVLPRYLASYELKVDTKKLIVTEDES